MVLGSGGRAVAWGLLKLLQCASAVHVPRAGVDPAFWRIWRGGGTATATATGAREGAGTSAEKMPILQDVCFL